MSVFLKTNTCFLLALLFFFPSLVSGQITTVNNWNYFDVNENAFTSDASCFGLSPSEETEYEYWLTTLQLAEKTDSLFKSGADTSDVVVGDYRISMRNFLSDSLAGDAYRWMLLRPDDTVQRPIVMVTHGGKSGGSSSRRIISLGAYDYVQRGYAVVFYQSGPLGNAADRIQTLMDGGLPNYCHYDWSPDFDMRCFECAVYLKFKLAVAATQYAVGRHQDFDLDTANIFVSAFSGGGVGAMYQALTDVGDFSDTLFSGMGTFTDLSKYPTMPYGVDAVAGLAAGLVDASSNPFHIGNVLDPGDAHTRFVLFHGQDDFAVQPQTSPLIWSTPEGTLPGSQIQTLFDLKAALDGAGIANRAILNCSACHDVYTFPCDYNDDCVGNNPQFVEIPLPPDSGDCVIWANNQAFLQVDYSNPCGNANWDVYWPESHYMIDQVHDYCKVAARYFYKDLPPVGPPRQPDVLVDALINNTAVSAVNPKDFPFDLAMGATNGHWELSTKCLAQTCSALYLNRDGLGDNILLGDYVTFPAVATMNDFNQDFSLEVRFKAIDHSGVGALFSALNNLQLGFELFINGNGELRFQKRVGNFQALNGTSLVLDDSCHVVTITREGNEFGMYLDGVLEDTLKNFTVSYPAADAYLVGNSSIPSGRRGFNGVVRYVRLWDRVLSTSEMGQEQLLSGTTNLIADWQMDEGVSQGFLSTNGTYPAFLGETDSTSANDPKWMQDDSLCQCFTDSLVTSLEASELSSPFLVYPNPSTGEFTIRGKNSVLNSISYRLFDLQGRLIKQGDLLNEETKVHLDKRGMFLLILEGGGMRQTIRVVNQ